jgi:hypothetical protein
MKHATLIALVAAACTTHAQTPASDRIPPKPPVTVSSASFVPMPLQERLARGVVPKRGFVSTGVNGGTIYSGNGKLIAEIPGNPLNELVTFHHEAVIQPWKRPFEAPKIANVLPQVKRLILAGQYREALELSLHTATEAGMPPGTMNHSEIPPFRMRIALPTDGFISDYLRTVNFESGELKVLWKDGRGNWVRQSFVSRPDNVAVQYLTAPSGKPLDAVITIDTEPARRGNIGPQQAPREEKEIVYDRDFNSNRLIVTGRFRPEFGNQGFAGVTRISANGGTVAIDDGKLVLRGVQSAVLLTRIEEYQDFTPDKIEALTRAVDELPQSYATLLERQTQVQSEIIDRMSMDFGGKREFGVSSEELLTNQRSRIGYSPALLEQIFEMGRYWLLAEGTGDFPSIAGHLNINVNLQIAPAAMAALPEASETFDHWIEGLMPDSRKNAENIFGARGAFVTVHPDQQQGVMYHFAYNWPHHYWISAGGWAYSPIWDYYLTTGDKTFLRDHIVPGLKELALFYEDFLTEKDANGNYIFVPSYSPENWPANSDSAPTVINAVMDISVCKEVFTHLIQASEILGTDADQVPRWKAMLSKMPPYLIDTDGALKEWAWPMLEENQDHRHASHLYGVWPSDEIDPDTTPDLARAAWLADRKRAQGNASGHGISHRALAAARLKDDYLVNMELKQFFEQGYIGPTLRTSHNPYTSPMPDQQGSIPTIMMEMLLYSRPGVIEVLPALPVSITKGSMKGMLARTFARVDDLTWNMEAKTVDITITSRIVQEITLTARHGIRSISAPSGVITKQPAVDATTCTLHLPEGKPVAIHLQLGNKKPSDWVRQTVSAKGAN